MCSECIKHHANIHHGAIVQSTKSNASAHKLDLSSSDLFGFWSPFEDDRHFTNSVYDNFDVWCKELIGDMEQVYLLEGIKFGFKISDVANW